VIATLRQHADELRALGASHLYLFGSVARNEARGNSDVDLFMEFDDPKFSLIDLLTLQYRLEDLLHRDADLMTRGSLHPVLRDDIERQALQVF
jgi:predicted nucleotidyltransferase